MLSAFFGNLLTCAVFSRKSNLFTSTNVSIAVLAVSDILSAVLLMPFSLASLIRGRRILWEASCVFNAYLMVALLGLTIICMTCIAVIRYCKVLRPSLHHHLKPKRTVIVIFSIWLAFFLLILTPAFVEFPGGLYSERRGFCRLVFMSKTVKDLNRKMRYVTLTFGVLYTLIMFTAYYKVFRFVSHHNQRVAPKLQRGISPKIEEAKVTKTLVIVFAGFVMCWIPTGIIEGIILTRRLRIHRMKLPEFVIFLETIFIFTSNAVNPLIYTFTNRRFRKEHSVFLRSLLPLNGSSQLSVRWES